jgi:hypothetical protein
MATAFDGQQKEKKVIGITILEIFRISQSVIVICEMENGFIPKPGMFMRVGKYTFNVYGVGHPKNLINSPLYRELLLEKNLGELHLNYSAELIEQINTGVEATLGN